MGIAASGLPVLEVDEAKVERAVMKNMDVVVKDAMRNKKTFPAQMKKTAPKPFKVPKCGKLELLEGRSSQKDVIEASVLAAVSKRMRKETTNEVDQELRPELKQQFAELDPKLPKMAEKHVLAATKKTVIAKLVDIAYDKLIITAQERLATNDDGGEAGATTADKSGEKSTKNETRDAPQDAKTPAVQLDSRTKNSLKQKLKRAFSKTKLPAKKQTTRDSQRTEAFSVSEESVSVKITEMSETVEESDSEEHSEAGKRTCKASDQNAPAKHLMKASEQKSSEQDDVCESTGCGGGSANDAGCGGDGD